ncbi:MAG: hypothetical protein IPJ53_17880 [Saprospiraceae bacterium]|nr:hypothetical protein [Candidatus Vicinibacter affinis]
MAKKFHILLIILTLGIFATPTLTYACGKNQQKQKNLVAKNLKAKKQKKECCKKSNSQNDKENNGCDGKCNNSNCSCPTVHFAFALPFYAELKAKTNFTESKKTKLYYNENYLSDGFTSIWTPPNIG